MTHRYPIPSWREKRTSRADRLGYSRPGRRPTGTDQRDHASSPSPRGRGTGELRVRPCAPPPGCATLRPNTVESSCPPPPPRFANPHAPKPRQPARPPSRSRRCAPSGCCCAPCTKVTPKPCTAWSTTGTSPAPSPPSRFLTRGSWRTTGSHPPSRTWTPAAHTTWRSRAMRRGRKSSSVSLASTSTPAPAPPGLAIGSADASGATVWRPKPPVDW